MSAVLRTPCQTSIAPFYDDEPDNSDLVGRIIKEVYSDLDAVGELFGKSEELDERLNRVFRAAIAADPVLSAAFEEHCRDGAEFLLEQRQKAARQDYQLGRAGL